MINVFTAFPSGLLTWATYTSKLILIRESDISNPENCTSV